MRQMLALQTWFRTNFAYDEDVDYSGRSDALSAFLEDRRGFCQQFSSAFALLARTLGLPSRVAVGFTPGDPTVDADGDVEFVVRGRHAHAWPEVHFAGIGWVPLNPRPSVATPRPRDTRAWYPAPRHHRHRRRRRPRSWRHPRPNPRHPPRPGHSSMPPRTNPRPTGTTPTTKAAPARGRRSSRWSCSARRLRGSPFAWPVAVTDGIGAGTGHRYPVEGPPGRRRSVRSNRWTSARPSTRHPQSSPTHASRSTSTATCSAISPPSRPSVATPLTAHRRRTQPRAEQVAHDVSAYVRDSSTTHGPHVAAMVSRSSE